MIPEARGGALGQEKEEEEEEKGLINLSLVSNLLCSPGWPLIPYVSKDDFELLILRLSQMLVLQMHTSPCLLYVVLRWKLGL